MSRTCFYNAKEYNSRFKFSLSFAANTDICANGTEPVFQLLLGQAVSRAPTKMKGF